METLDRDVLLYLAYDLDMPSIYRLCRTSKRFNRLICENDTFWKNKLLQYGVKNLANFEDPKEAYKQIIKNEGLLGAAMRGNIYRIKYLVASRPPISSGNLLEQNHQNEDLNTPLIFASEEGHLEVVKYLLEHGANIHSAHNASVWRASARGRLDTVKYLVEHGANIYATPYYGKNSIEIAKQYEQKKVVNYLTSLKNKRDKKQDKEINISEFHGH